MTNVKSYSTFCSPYHYTLPLLSLHTHCLLPVLHTHLTHCNTSIIFAYNVYVSVWCHLGTSPGFTTTHFAHHDKATRVLAGYLWARWADWAGSWSLLPALPHHHSTLPHTLQHAHTTVSGTEALDFCHLLAHDLLSLGIVSPLSIVMLSSDDNSIYQTW